MALKPVSGKIESQEINDNFSYLDSKTDQISGGPIDTVSSESELYSKYPNGAKGPVVVLESDQTGYMYTWDGDAWRRGAIYQSRGIGKNSVHTEHTDFLLPSSDNIFNGVYYNLFMSGVEPYDVREGTAKSAIVEVPNNFDVHVLISSDTNRLRVGVFSNYPNVGVVPNDMIVFKSDTYNQHYGTVSTGTSGRYLLIQVSTNDTANTPRHLQVSLSETVKKTKPNTQTLDFNIDVGKGSINAKNTDFLKRSTINLFDGHFNSGFLSGVEPHDFRDDENGRYALVRIYPNRTYTIYKSSDSDRFRFATFKDIPSHGAVPNQYNNRAEYFESDTISFETLESDNYLLIVVSSTSANKTPSQLQVSEGSAITSYEPPYVFDQAKTGFSASQTPKENEVNHIITDDLSDLYTNHYKELVSLDDRDLGVLYGYYDTLMSNYPDYISKTKLADDTSGLPIYRYDFKAPSARNYEENLPKLLYVSGIHGDERLAIVTGIRFFTDLCDNWKESEINQALRWNVHFIVIPCLCPYGFVNGSRFNSNGVNINRNFPPGWEPSEESGPEPLSEVESQVIDDILTNHPDIMFAIDHHRFNNFDWGNYAAWFWSGSDKVNKLLAGAARQLSSKLKIDHPEIDQDNTSLIALNNTGVRATLREYFHERGVPGMILEVVRDEYLLDFTTDVLGNVIKNVVKYMHNDKNEWL